MPWPKAKPTPAAGGDKAKPGATATADAKAEDEDKPKSDDAAEAKPAATTAAGEKAKPAGPSLDAVPAVMALLDEAAKLAGPEAVAQYFGAPPAASSDDQEARPALEREKKRFTAQREILARTERLRADVQRATGVWDAAWKALAEVRRWEPEPGDKQTRAIEAATLEQAKLFGLALDALNARLKDGNCAQIALRSTINWAGRSMPRGSGCGSRDRPTNARWRTVGEDEEGSAARASSAQRRTGRRACPTFGNLRACSARRPAQRTLGKEMDVEMRNGFAAVGAVVDHEPKAVSQLQFFRKRAGREQ